MYYKQNINKYNYTIIYKHLKLNKYTKHIAARTLTNLEGSLLLNLLNYILNNFKFSHNGIKADYNNPILTTYLIWDFYNL